MANGEPPKGGLAKGAVLAKGELGEAPNGERVICFTALEKDGKGATVVGETVQLDVSEFALFQPLFGVAA